MEIRKNIDELGNIALFRGLTSTELLSIFHLAQQLQVKKGGYFFHQETPVSAMYVLLWGQVKLTQLGADGRRVLIRIAGPCEDFGAVAALANIRYPLTAQAVDDCLAASWSRETIDVMVKDFPRVATNALKLVTQRFQQLQTRYRELATKRVEQRVARTLLRLAEQAGQQTEAGMLIDLTLSRQDLAEMTGTTLYSISRILSSWERQGIVQIGREQVILCNFLQLFAIAEDLPPGSVPKYPS